MSNTKCSDCGIAYQHQNDDRCSKCGSLNRTVTLIINETESTPENSVVTIVMTFDLWDSVQIGGDITNSSNLKFIEDPEHLRSINQFQIKLINPTLLDEKKALEKASQITNYLSVKANRIVKHKLPIIRRITGNIMTNTVNFSVDVFLHKDFDLDANRLDSILLDKNMDLNKRLQLYNDGLKELENNDFAGAIQSFYQCIENTSLSTTEYKALRDGASHQKIKNVDVINELTRIGIKIKKDEPLNENDPDNQHILSIKAQSLKLLVWTFLNTQLSNL